MTRSAPAHNPSPIDGDGRGPAGPGRLLTVVAVIAAGIVVAFPLAGFIAGVANGTVFSGYSADGPFQLYNPLRRIAAGEIPGHDFPFFHGVGVVLLHVPAFMLFGENIFAAEVSRFLVSPLVFVVATALFMRAMLGEWRRALVATALAACLVAPLGRMIDPSNSLLGIRSTFPVLAAAALLWRPRSRPLAHRFGRGHLRFDVPTILCWVLLGASVSFGTEQALGAIIAFALVRATGLLRTGRRLRTLVRLPVELVAIAVLTVAVSAVLTAGHPFEALRYALIDIPSDQGWVFGAPPNAVFSVPGLVGELTWLTPQLFVQYLTDRTSIASAAVHLVAVNCAVAAMVVAVRSGALPRRTVGPVLMLALGATIAAAAGVATGYLYLPDQMSPLGRIALTVLAGAVVSLVPRSAAAARRGSSSRLPSPLRRAAGAVVLVLAVTVVAYSSVGIPAKLRGLGATEALQRIGASAQATDRELAGPGWVDALDEIDALVPADARVWASYAGIAQSARGQIVDVPGGEDYQIHAVGDQRREAYDAALADLRPEAVLTMTPFEFPYEEWLWSKWPEFYITLFSQYSLQGTAGPYKVWTAADRTSTEYRAGPGVSESADGIRIAPTEPGASGTRVLLIDVEYTAEGVIAPLSRASRYLLQPDGSDLGFAISLPPNERSWRFLLPVDADAEVHLRPVVSGVFGGDLDIDRVEVREVVVPSENLALFDELYCVVNDDGYCP